MHRISPVIFAVVMGFFMSSTVTIVMALINVGYSDGFFGKWVISWIETYPVVTGCILAYRPVAMRVTSRVMGILTKASEHPHG